MADAMALPRALRYEVAGVPYLVHPQILGTVTRRSLSNKVIPAVLIKAFAGDDAPKDVDCIVQEILAFADIDDVYQEAFRSTLILQVDSEEPSNIVDALRSKLLTMPGHFLDIHQSTASPSSRWPPGPYFLCGHSIHQAWRLYSDDLDTFIFGVIPYDTRSHIQFEAVTELSTDGIHRTIAVRSRLYTRPTTAWPLAGARIALKDIYKLSGVKTTMMSRHYTALYGPDRESADYVKKLIKLGAVIVGKTKMTSFASLEEPTDQWIDFHCPVNSRGDGYQSPSGSSQVRRQRWLVTIGLTTQSVVTLPEVFEHRQRVMGCFRCGRLLTRRRWKEWLSTLRESLIPACDRFVGEILITYKAFDVVGHFSRSLDDLKHIVANTLDTLTQWEKFPSRILYPLDFFPHSNPTHQAMVEEAVCLLENFLNTKRVELIIAERWTRCPPAAAKGKSLKEYLAKSAFWSMCRDYNTHFSQYRSDFRTKFDKEPYVGAIVNFRWALGREITDNEYQAYTE
ncbi:hypothetical protein CC86DRAFT_411834 [Ophiobolus disseminans]|uniref:Amidase domain-containing protein n=1 Tax=Ophiobolus disseminans TaxID=1469910 RepID=A0A6A6ZIG6_9PLEO|nr:hypothetical protein CC86DRAFT_411834 [Ophiobolus disseminans]